jgi:CHAT domain-containing protein
VAIAEEETRESFVAAHPELWRAAVVSALARRASDFSKQDPNQALGFARAAASVARRIADPALLGVNVRAEANALYALNHHRAAVERHDQALAVFEQVGDATQIARTLSASIQPLILLGEYERAFAAAARARAIFLAEPNPWRLARMEVNEGNIYHRLDRFAEALACYQRAYQTLIEHQDAEAAAAALNNMASTLISLGDHRRALEIHGEARALCERRGMPLLLALTDYNIAYLHFLRGDYHRAIEILLRSRRSAEGLGDVYQYALCQMDLAEIYLEVNLAEEAAEMAQEAHVRFRRLGLGYEAAKSLAFRAIAFGQQGRAAGALELLAEAGQAFAAERNAAWVALIDLYRALILYNEGRWSEARSLCAAALDSFAASLQPNKALLCRVLLARLHFRAGELERALEECGLAIERLETLDSPALVFQTNLLRGQVLLATGDQDAALRAFEVARSALETLRGNLRSDELKIAFVANRLEVYEHLVELCLGRGSTGAGWSDAFTYMEQAKSRSLTDLLLQPLQSLAAPDAGQSEAVRTIRTLREELNWYYSLIERERLCPAQGSAERIARLEESASARERGLLRRLRELPTADADYASLQSPSTVAVATIREALPEGALLIEYFRMQDRFVAALLTRQSLEIVPVAETSRVAERLRLLRFQLSKFRLGPEYVSEFSDQLLDATIEHLSELHRQLFAPLGDRVRARHLIFVPHDVLHHVPLHALFDGERHLIESFTVSYAPSATLYALCHGKQAVGGGGSLVLGVPDPQAPLIREEVQTVAAVLPRPDLYFGADATATVLRTKGPSTRLLHLASHGHFRQDSPMFSGIRLGDGYLSLYDLYSLKVPAELATLSGCSTGAGVVSAGDEVRGLVRGLIYAGVQSMLLTLWDVHDCSTAEFMEGFYRRFVADGDKAAALRGAMLEVRGRYPHPYHWAPFILVGKVFAS